MTLPPPAHRAPRAALAVLLALAATAAAAHDGGDAGAHHGLLAGLLHPFTGVDHLLAMLAVGLAGGLRAPGGAARWAGPAAFAACLLAGAGAAAAGLPVPAIEPMIAASLMVLGLALTMPQRGGALPAALLAGGFALFHGAAHGVELSGAAALAGMLAGTVALHAAGLWGGSAMRRFGPAGATRAARLMGVGVALTGITAGVGLMVA